MSALFVNRAEFREALRFIKQYLPPKRKKVDIYLAYEAGKLVVQIGPLAATAEAQGTWEGVARCSPLVVLALLQGLPDMEQIPVQVEHGNRLRVGHLTFECEWDTSPDRPIQLPLNATLSTVLSLPYRYSQDEIDRAGLTFVLRDAEKKRNTALNKAAEALKPLDISRDEVFAWVERRLKRMVAPIEEQTDNLPGE